jgi:hypothetical protein
MIFEIQQDPFILSFFLLGHGVKNGWGFTGLCRTVDAIFIYQRIAGFHRITIEFMISSPHSTVKVCRWGPQQCTDGLREGEYPIDGAQHWEFMDWPQMHGPPFVVGSLAYLSYYSEGLIILDISDITRPKKIGQLKLKGPFSGKYAGARTHTCLPLPGEASWWQPMKGSVFPLQQKILSEGPGKGAQPRTTFIIDISIRPIRN